MEIERYSMNFESLVGQINQVQDVLQAQAAHAVNLSLTARNWLVGCIYLVYPQLGTEIGAYLHNNSLGIPDASGNSIWQSVTAKLQTSENQLNEILQSAIAKLEEWSTPANK